VAAAAHLQGPEVNMNVTAALALTAK